MAIRNLWLAALALPVASCSSVLGGYNSDYSCPGLPKGVRCEAAHDVYAKSVTGELGAERKAVDADGKLPISPPLQQTSVEAGQPILASDGAIPVRTPSAIMRIWVNAWEDKAGNLHMPGPVFTEIEKRRWQIGVAGLDAADQVHPVALTARNAAPVGTGTGDRGKKLVTSKDVPNANGSYHTVVTETPIAPPAPPR